VSLSEESKTKHNENSYLETKKDGLASFIANWSYNTKWLC